jgi:peptidyl-prolyl cis-trans isomerase B (cyclophilin B)
MALKAEMVTAKGTMWIEFFEEDAPIAVKNFTDLAKKGFYDNLTFHRVIPDSSFRVGVQKGLDAEVPATISIAS